MNVLGIDLGGTNVRAAVVRDQRLGEVSAIRVNPRGSVDEVLDQI